MKKDLEIEKSRVEYAINRLNEVGYYATEVTSDCIQFEYKGNIIKIFPYKGWFTGKGIKDGRGIENLIKQICKHPRDKRTYIGSNLLRCNICKLQFR